MPREQFVVVTQDNLPAAYGPFDNEPAADRWLEKIDLQKAQVTQLEDPKAALDYMSEDEDPAIARRKAAGKPVPNVPKGADHGRENIAARVAAYKSGVKTESAWQIAESMVNELGSTSGAFSTIVRSGIENRMQPGDEEIEDGLYALSRVLDKSGVGNEVLITATWKKFVEALTGFYGEAA